MWIAYTLIQTLALLMLVCWAVPWSGKNPRWLTWRGRGWFAPLFFLAGFFFMQAIALAVLAFPGANEAPVVDSDLLRATMALLVLIPVPITLVGMLFWWPRFMLPGWIRERLDAGDPARTPHPLPEVQHRMTKPQNTVMLTRFDPSQHRDAG